MLGFGVRAGLSLGLVLTSRVRRQREHVPLIVGDAAEDLDTVRDRVRVGVGVRVRVRVRVGARARVRVRVRLLPPPKKSMTTREKGPKAPATWLG